MLSEARITGADLRVYTVPTDAPEADGTFAWDQTTMVLVQLTSGSTTGIGYTYADEGTAKIVEKLLDKAVGGRDAFAHAAILNDMYRSVRNLGTTGASCMAISAVDNALWDLRARLLGVALVNLLGRVRESIEVYGSGGFTSYSDQQLQSQFAGWAVDGIRKFKMKVGTRPDDDPRRVRVARQVIGDLAALFVDANGAYTVAQAIRMAHIFADSGVSWFEEPVSSDDLVGMRQVRQSAPPGMDIAAGEYGYTAWYFRRMIDSQALTVLQADATRCCGTSGFLDAASLCWADQLPLSTHSAPSLHLHACCAVPRAIHMEFFHDHARIERMFFDGFCAPRDGHMTPDQTRPGMGLTLREKDVEQYRK